MVDMTSVEGPEDGKSSAEEANTVISQEPQREPLVVELDETKLGTERCDPTEKSNVSVPENRRSEKRKHEPAKKGVSVSNKMMMLLCFHEN